MTGRQDWRTPPAMAAQLAAELGPWHMDVAASRANALAPVWITAAQDALAPTTAWHGTVWCNPPYRVVLPWVRRAVARAAHSRTVMLVPAAMDTRWAQMLTRNSDWWLTAGRVRFVHPDTGAPGNSPPNGHLIAHFWDGSAGNGRWCGYRDAQTGEVLP